MFHSPELSPYWIGIEIISALVLDADRMTNDQSLEIIKAIKTGDMDYISQFVNNNWLGIRLMDEDGCESYAIHYAALYGQLEIVQLFLEKESHLLNLPDTLECTPISYAAAKGHVQVVDYLAKMGADLSIAMNYSADSVHGYLPIHWATVSGHLNVVECLIQHGADVHMTLGVAQYHLIHIASKMGQLEIIKLILNDATELLNIIDAYGQTPMWWAAAYGHAHVVAYFIAENANLNIATNRPNHVDHKKTPLMKAMEYGHYEAANLIILKITAHQSRDTILPFVQTGTQALEFMMVDPGLISLFLKNRRIFHLIEKTGCNINDQFIDWYKPAYRRPSWFAQIDRKEQVFSLFKPVKQIGKGSYGKIRLFQSDDGQKIAVKSLYDDGINLSKKEHIQLAKALNREAELNQRAYPNDSFSKAFELDYKESYYKIYTNRYVMNYVEGEKLRLLVPQITCPRQLAEMTLKIAEELQRIHNVGIIHGDLNTDNILIYSSEKQAFIVRLIDFGASSDITEVSANLYNNSVNAKWIAPEIRNNGLKAVKPHPRQDVFAFGYTLNYLLEKHSARDDLMQLFPSIETFILASQNSDPMKRQSLALFCEYLFDDLYPTIEMDVLPWSSWGCTQS